MSGRRDRAPEAAPPAVVQLLGAETAARLARYVLCGDPVERCGGPGGRRASLGPPVDT